MPQWRKLHTRICQSLDLNDMPDDFHRLLWTWLPLGLDREGRILDNAALVKAKVMPLREDVTLERVQQALNWYADSGMIVRYSINGRAYFYVPTFPNYQGRRGREGPSIYPVPPRQEQVAEEVTESVQEQVIEQVTESVSDEVTAQNRIESEQKRIESEQNQNRRASRSRTRTEPPPSVPGFKRPADLILAPSPDLTDQKDQNGRAPPGFNSFTAAKQEELVVRHLQNAQQRPLDDDQLNTVRQLMQSKRPSLALEMAQRTDDGKAKKNAVGYWIRCLQKTQEARGP